VAGLRCAAPSQAVLPERGSVLSDESRSALPVAQVGQSGRALSSPGWGVVGSPQSRELSSLATPHLGPATMFPTGPAARPRWSPFPASGRVPIPLTFACCPSRPVVQASTDRPRVSGCSPQTTDGSLPDVAHDGTTVASSTAIGYQYPFSTATYSPPTDATELELRIRYGVVGRERTYKPGSVPRIGVAVIYLRRRSPDASSDLTRGLSGQPHSPPIRSCSGRGLPGRPVTRPPVGSYPTISPLPGCPGGVISVALSFESPRLGVTQRPALWSPDFPPNR
jgi:hypothetical protein